MLSHEPLHQSIQFQLQNPHYYSCPQRLIATGRKARSFLLRTANCCGGWKSKTAANINRIIITQPWKPKCLFLAATSRHLRLEREYPSACCSDIPVWGILSRIEFTPSRFQTGALVLNIQTRPRTHQMNTTTKRGTRHRFLNDERTLMPNIGSGPDK